MPQPNYLMNLSQSEKDCSPVPFANHLTMQSAPQKIRIYQPTDPLQDGISRLELVGVMGSDKDVVSDARTSYAKDRGSEFNERDYQLLVYLLKNKHTSPLRGSALKFTVKAPLFICRQWWKHVVASAAIEEQVGWNEQSFRYTVATREFYVPKQLFGQSSVNKQQSDAPLSNSEELLSAYRRAMKHNADIYDYLLEQGTSREQARAVLPPAVYTTWVWTASLQSVLHFIALRDGHGAQAEIARYARDIEVITTQYFPRTIEAFKEVGRSL